MSCRLSPTAYVTRTLTWLVQPLLVTDLNARLVETGSLPDLVDLTVVRAEKSDNDSEKKLYKRFCYTLMVLKITQAASIFLSSIVLS